MLHILILYSFLNLTQENQENIVSQILPKENQFIKGMITNLDEKISKTQILGFGLWFKWQPFALQDILSNTNTDCQNQFIFSLENQEKTQSIYILYLRKNELEYKLNIFSDFFIFTEEIQLIDQFEGVWMFLNSFFDFHKKLITFYLYKSDTQVLSQYQIDEIVILQNQLQYQIGNVCDQCSISNFGSCFSRFEGRISILFEQDNFDESSYLNYLQTRFNLINDCKEVNRQIIAGSQIFDGDFYSVINLGILEKYYFQLSGWVRVNYDDSYLVYYDIFQIVSNFKENLSDFNLKIYLYYILSTIQSYNGIFLKANPEFQLLNKPPVRYVEVNILPPVLRQWHFIQIDVGYPNQAGTLKFYSYQLNEVNTLRFDQTSYTGYQFGLLIGGDKYSTMYLKGNIANLVFKTFCKPIEQEFKIMCHYTCEACFGPLYDNCLSCKSSNKRILKNDQCVCDSDAFQFQEFEACQTITGLFQNLITIEEELSCKQEGYDRCDDTVICSFGYFKYQEKYCIQCPQYSSMNSNSNILCANCFIAPESFSMSQTCGYDILKLNQGGESTFDTIYRSNDNIECFEIIKLKNKYQLQLIENKISNNPPLCRGGYYYENQKCQQCGFGCFKCISSIICSQCEEGYYLNNNNVCAKCKDCLKCELKKEIFNCLSCPQKYYLKNQQCFQCGQFCADCRSNGYCNYCIDSQKYFISIDGINCLVCNIQNCKYCYQVNKIDYQIFYTSFNLNLENYINEKQSIDKTIYCAKCKDGYIVDLYTNTCIQRFEINVVCQFGSQNSFYFQCQSSIDVPFDTSSSCNSLRNCKLCVQNKCIECQIGFYIDLLAKGCQKCPSQCQNCIFQNQRLMDNYKFEILARYDQIELQLKPDILSNIKSDYKIQCTSCPLNYILYNSDCILGCNEECLKCEVFEGKAKCVECKTFDSRAVRSINSQGQCLRCQKNCQQCGEEVWGHNEINKFFIFNQQNQIHTRICYQSLPVTEGKKDFINQFTAIVCEKYDKCKHKGIFNWNLYCDIEQFKKIQNKQGYFQEGNYYFNDFFEKEILSKIEIENLWMFLNEQVIEQIDIIINIYQGNVNSCKPLKPLEDLIKIQSTFSFNIYFFKGVTLKILGQQNNILIKDFIFNISGFQEIQFENLNFQSNQIKITDILINQINFINCSFEDNSPISTPTPYNLNLINVTIEITDITQDSIFQFYFRDDESIYQDIKIIIDGLRIINSKFQNSKLISIITDIGPKVTCQVDNLEILQTEFENSFLLASSTSSGLKNMYIGNLYVTKLKIQNVNLKNSILFYTPNILQFNINTLTIQKFKLLSNSYLVLSNQFNFQNFQLEEIQIDKSYLFSNKVTLLYQTSFADHVNIYFNQITIKNSIYNQEQSFLQFIRYINCKVIVNLNYFRITEVNQLFAQQNLISQEKSLIHISCTECYLNQIYITRKNGIPELSLIDTELIIISNSIFTQNEKQAKALIEDCQPKVQNQFPYFIYIGQYQQIRIDNLTIFDAISFNYPFIILKGIVLQNQFEENIEIINSKFLKNQLITSASNSPTSIIQIYTEQKCFINITNLQFSDNHLNVEYQDLITHSSSSLLLDTQLGKIFMKDCLFQQNIVTNSTDSPLYSKAQGIEIFNSRFIQNNILNFQSLINRIQLNSLGVKVNNFDLQQIIQVFSNGGSGYFLTNNLSLKNCSVEESYSIYGGAFYVNTFGNAFIQIEDSTFTKTSSSLQSSSSSNGGCFYIDAQISKLTLLVINSTFNQSYSRSKGGCFFIVPSNSYNFVYFEQIQVVNSFSTASQFFDYSLQNLNNIISNVTFYKIQLVYDKIAFEQFLGLLENLSSDEALMIVNNGPIIMIKYGNITISSIYCQFEIKIYLSQIEQGQNININEIYVDKGFIWNSPFLSLNLKSDFEGELRMQNLRIYNLQEYQEMNDSKRCEKMLVKNVFKQFCISPVFVSEQISFENKMEQIEQITFCQNKNLIFQSEKIKFSLIMINNINTYHYIIVNEVILNRIICRNCNDGILSLTNVYQTEENNIILNGISIQKSVCGITGCLTIVNKNSNNFLKTNFLKKESRILQEQNFESLKNTFDFQVSLTNSRFIQNMADYGGAVCVIDLDIVIDQCYFFKNQAKVGGAIYSFVSQQQNFRTIIFASLFVDNSAELAADLYLENQMLHQTEKLQVIVENNSTTQVSNVFEKPRALAITTNQDSIVLQKKIVLSTSIQVVEKTIIKPYTIPSSKDKVETLMFPSGQTIEEYQYFDISTSTNIPYNLSLKIIALNMLNQKEDQLNGSICTLEHKVINLTSSAEIDDFYAKLSISQIAFNTSTLDFNLNNLIISFNPYYEKEIVLRLYIKCNMIQIPVYDKEPPYLITNLITDYTLLADIKTFPCQLGEYFNSTSKICIKCNSDQSQYQVELNANICQIKDEAKIKSVESGKIELIPKFWRAYFYSTKIEECYHLTENCLGGWYPGDKSCTFGHIGALCEQCDLYNIRGDGHFSISSPYKCSSCELIEGNIIAISLISVWTLVSVLMSVNSTIDTIKLFIAGSKLILFGVSSLSKQSSTAVLIKVFTNYLQIIQTISTFQLKVPAGLSQFFTSVGNPIEQVAYSLDCFLMSISDISIIYFRIIWSLLMAISYVSTFFLFLAIALLLKYIKFNISMITTALIYIFIFLQPNIIQSLISLVSFRILSDIAWIQGNVAYHYDTASHKYWMISFCLPILISFSLLIPLLMFYCIRSNKHHLDLIKTRETWGYLYNEYKLKAYFWEFIKIFQKELIIIFLAYYEDFIAIKASLVFLVIFAYSFISTSVQPYMTGELNRFDSQSTTVCAVSIILGSSIYTAQNQNFIEIVYPFYIIIALINGWFLFKIIINIFIAYFDQLHEQIDKAKEIISQKFPNYVLKYPKVKKLLESKKTKLQKIQSRFSMIKQYLIPKAQKIIKLKKGNQQQEKDCDLFIKKVDQKIQTNYTTINKYPKPENSQLKPKLYTDSDSQRSFEDQQD